MTEPIQTTRMRRLPTVFGVFTTFSDDIPDVKRFCPGTFVPVLKTLGKCSCLRAKPAHIPGHLPHFGHRTGKLAEGSDKLDPMIGNQAESSDKAEPMELIPHPKRTLLRPWMKICLLSFLLKSALLFSNESDDGNRVRRFTQTFRG